MRRRCDHCGHRHLLACAALLLSLCLPSQAALRLPVNAEIVDEDLKGGGWRQNARLHVTYVSAVNQLKATIGQQGWRLKQEIKMGQTGAARCLLVFVRDKAEISVMVWSIGVSETGFSWGMSTQETPRK